MSNESKHAPGPWKTWFSEASGIWVISNESGRMRIAETMGFEPPESDEANARLIASAPSLLSEVEQLRKVKEEAEDMLNTLQNELRGVAKENENLKSLVSSYYGGGFANQDIGVPIIHAVLYLKEQNAAQLAAIRELREAIKAANSRLSNWETYRNITVQEVIESLKAALSKIDNQEES